MSSIMRALGQPKSRPCQEFLHSGYALAYPTHIFPFHCRGIKMWIPGQRRSPNFPPPRPGFSLEHPDNLPPDQRYPFRLGVESIPRINGSIWRQAKLRLTSDNTRPIKYSFEPGPGSDVHVGQRCQLVWDNESKSASIYTEDGRPVPTSKRLFKEMLAGPPRSTSGPWIVDALVKRGLVTQEGQ